MSTFGLKESVRIQDTLSGADYAVFFAIILLTVAAVVWGNTRKQVIKDGNEGFLDYLLMGRRLTLPLFTMTLVATWYGGIFGVTEIAFRHGIYNFLIQGIFWYVTYLVFAFFLVPRISRIQAVTLPELIGKLFGRRSLAIASVFNLLNVLPVAYCISIGILIQAWTGWSLLWSMAAGTFFVAGYAAWGGFRAVVVSDVIQFGVMCSAVAFVLFFSFGEFGGLSFLRTHLPSSHFDWSGGHSWAATLVWGLIALSTLVDPNFYQRCFAARSPKVARNGILISTVIWCVFDLCTTLGAMYARAVLSEAEPGQAYLIYGLQILPSGLRGLFIAGILAVILSTMDSYLFIASNTVGYDMMPERWKRSVKLNRFLTLVLALATILLASVFEGSIKSVWKTLGSFSAGCLLFPVLVGYIKPGWISDRLFFGSVLTGASAMIFWSLFPILRLGMTIELLYIGVFMTAGTIFIVKLVAYFRN